jgi:hypothetical protein
MFEGKRDMSETIVKHPETGLPAREVKTYIELDREQLEQELEDNQADLDELLATKRSEFEASLDEDPDVKAARSAVQNSKSELSVHDKLTSEPTDNAGEAGAVSAVESDEEAGDEPDGSDGSEADPEPSPAKPRKVPVTEVVDENLAKQADVADDEIEVADEDNAEEDDLDKDY